MAILTKSSDAREASAPCEWSATEAMDEAKRQVRRALTDIRHRAEDATSEAELKIRRRPFATIGLATCVGATVAGILVRVVLQIP
jgi:ElaB/YqjD/DUF883 family membrane-anchored ribosome-binding protein